MSIELVVASDAGPIRGASDLKKMMENEDLHFQEDKTKRAPTPHTKSLLAEVTTFSLEAGPIVASLALVIRSWILKHKTAELTLKANGKELHIKGTDPAKAASAVSDFLNSTD